MSSSSPRSPAAPSSALTLRLATRADLPELVRMRVACGWNEDAIEAYLERSLSGETDLLFIFETPAGEPAGMGALELESDEDPDFACKATGTVCLSWLFLYQKFQGASLGNLMVAMLEDRARALGKEWVTIHTRNWAPGPDNEELVGQDSRNKQWYRRLGYAEYKEPKPKYALTETIFFDACFMRKRLLA